ncbi:unnamed protein product, partial [Ectocarpus sp. 6 AP-2014]
ASDRVDQILRCVREGGSHALCFGSWPTTMEGSGHRPAQYGCPTRCISIDHINNAVLGCASLPHARPGVQVHRRLHCDLL